MSKVTVPGQMPPARQFGWPLREPEQALFNINQRSNGQFTVVLNHPLLRGVSSEMIAWWFRNFTRLSVILEDTPKYEGKTVPAYLLWHPSDHFGASLLGRTATDGAPVPGVTKIRVQEAMQYERYGWRYPVNTELTVFYCAADGWAMGRRIPLLGPVMMLRIHFKDVFQNDRLIGVHYHYEITIGVSGDSFVSRALNKRVTSAFDTEFFAAWCTHNVIEVGVFENFLPALFEQRCEAPTLRYHTSMNPFTDVGGVGHDRALFDRRVAALAEAADPHAELGFDQPTFL